MCGFKLHNSNQHACQIDQPTYEEFKFGHVNLTMQLFSGQFYYYIDHGQYCGPHY